MRHHTEKYLELRFSQTQALISVPLGKGKAIHVIFAKS